MSENDGRDDDELCTVQSVPTIGFLCDEQKFTLTNVNPFVIETVMVAKEHKIAFHHACVNCIAQCSLLRKLSKTITIAVQYNDLYYNVCFISSYRVGAMCVRKMSKIEQLSLWDALIIVEH